jgi:hypothetical protein
VHHNEGARRQAIAAYCMYALRRMSLDRSACRAAPQGGVRARPVSRAATRPGTGERERQPDPVLG